MSYLEEIYNHLPKSLQNVMVSIYGAKLYHERYMGSHKKYRDILLKNQWLSADQIVDNQNRALKSLIRHAYENVPYYRDILKSRGLHYDDFRTVDDLKKLPILQKDTVRKHFNDLIVKNRKHEKYIKLNTSGTTGKPLNIFVDIDSRRKEYAFITRSHAWAGLTSERNGATFGGRVIIPAKNKNKNFWRYNLAMNNYLFSSYHLSDENIPFYIEKLRKIRPQFIDSYPSSIYLIAKFMEEHHIDGIYPKAIVTSAETLMDHQKETIEKDLNVRFLTNMVVQSKLFLFLNANAERIM